MECKIAYCPSEEQIAIKWLHDFFTGIFLEGWASSKKAEKFDNVFKPDAVAVYNLWRNNGIKIITISENGEYIGYAICFNYKTVFTDRKIFQIDDIYARTDEALKTLITYIIDASHLTGCDEIWHTDLVGQDLPVLSRKTYHNIVHYHCGA